MNILYTSDGENPLTCKLSFLFGNFDSSGAKYYREDIENDLASRGWYEGMSEYGRFLILNLDKFGLKD